LLGYDLNHANKLYITNFPDDATEDQITQIFSQYGEIMRIEIKKEFPNLPNRCYLKYRTKEQALLAQREANGTVTLGNNLRP